MAIFILIFLHLTNVFYALGGNILGIPIQRSRGGGCPLPKKPDNGDYEVTDCVEGDFSSKCRKVAGTIVSSNTIIEYWCDPGYVLPENIDNSYCRGGNWTPQPPPSCQKLCKGLHSDSLTLQCTYRGRQVDCKLPTRPGTELKANCKDTYHIEDPSTTFTTTYCLSDGTWAHNLYKCVPECGIKNTINEVTPTLQGGTKAHQFEYPWHAGLFHTEAGNLHYLCGGTIIHPKAVLTAAHCVYNETLNRIADEKTMAVAVGKYRRDWNHREQSTEQKFKVKRIIIPDYYRGLRNLYEQDIAVLELDSFIRFNAAVMPVCIDRDERLGLYQGSNAVGNVVGWSAAETAGEKKDELRVAKFQVRAFHDCRKEVNDSDFITYDKFCAGLANGTSLERGDDGSGLTFPRFDNGVEQHFIYGVFSLYPPNSTQVASFTNITEHMKWITQQLNGLG